jgi:hypothetical protein
VSGVWTLFSLAVGSNQDGRLELVASAGELNTGDHALWHAWQLSADGEWSSWHPFGRPGDPTAYHRPAIVRNDDGCLEVVVSTIGGEVWHRRQAAPNQGWSQWQNLGRPSGHEFAISPPALGVNASGRPEAFVEEEDQVWHASQQAGLAWSAWSSLGQPASDSPTFHAVASNPEDGLELFTLGTVRGVSDDTPRAIWHRGQRASGEWSPWSSLGAPAADALPGTPEVFQHPDGRLELFTMARDGAVWHRRRSAPGGSCSAWTSLGSAAGGFDRFRSLDVGATVDGRPLVVATTGRNLSDVWQRRLTTADDWSPWSPIATPATFLSDPTLASHGDGRLELVVRAMNGRAFCQLRQTTPNGSWSPGRLWPSPDEPNL